MNRDELENNFLRELFLRNKIIFYFKFIFYNTITNFFLSLVICRKNLLKHQLLSSLLNLVLVIFYIKLTLKKIIVDLVKKFNKNIDCYKSSYRSNPIK